MGNYGTLYIRYLKINKQKAKEIKKNWGPHIQRPLAILLNFIFKT